MPHQFDTKHWILPQAGDNSVDKLVQHPHIQQAAEWILKGEVVAFPTETVYGLGANALSDKASRRIFEAKGRPSDNPLIVHISSVDQLCRVVDNIPGLGKSLISTFWPGPLTIVMPKGKYMGALVTANLSTVAVRMPDHPVALALIEACDQPLAAPSANRSGKPSPTQAEHVLHDLKGRIPGVLDGGPTGVGVESTVVDISGDKPMILRPGGITKQQLESVVGEVLMDPALEHSYSEQPSQEAVAPKSPGVKYKHYAPDGELWIVDHRSGMERMRSKIQALVNQYQQAGQQVGILTTDEGTPFYKADKVISLGRRSDLETVAQGIYHALRTMDQHKVQYILAESFPSTGLGEAIMNRLLKAAGGKVINL